jgi:hypothetical protein
MAVILVPGADWNANAPDDTSDVLVPRTNTVDITTNLDQAPDYYLSVETARGYMHDLGSAGTYLKCNIIKLRLLHGGNAWIMSDDDTNSGVSADPMLDTLVDMMEPGNNVYLTSEPTQAMNAGTVWYRVGINRGTVHMEAAMIFASTATVSVGTGGATLILSAETGNGNALPWLNVIGGKVDSDKTITRCYVSNATLVQNTKPITYLVIGPGGKVVYQHTVGTIIEVLAGGTLDLREKTDEQTITYIIVRKGGNILGYEDKFLAGFLFDERE